jgi:ankyrin repeat protein
MELFPLHNAVRNGDITTIKSLIASGSDVDAKDNSKRTPLHLAVWSGNLEICKLLILARADVSIKAMDMFTTLHFAAQKNIDKDILRLLVKKDKSLLNARISKGNKTALHLAVSKGLKENIQVLLELGADINAKTNKKETAMDMAKDPEIIQILQNFQNQISHDNLFLKRKSSLSDESNHTQDEESEQKVDTMKYQVDPDQPIVKKSKTYENPLLWLPEE